MHAVPLILKVEHVTNPLELIYIRRKHIQALAAWEGGVFGKKGGQLPKEHNENQ